MSKNLLSFLEETRAVFSLLEHEPTYTSQESADIRGVSLHSGAKALVLKVKQGFVLAVIPADFSLDSKALKRILSSKSMRFASRDELMELTGLTPGAVPPFGSLFNLPTYCDHGLSDNAVINFNAASHALSVSMSFDEYLRIEKPIMGSFSSLRPSS